MKEHNSHSIGNRMAVAGSLENVARNPESLDSQYSTGS